MSEEIRFIDLFRGIGGFHLGLERAGGYKCVWSNDIDKYASQIYEKRFPETPGVTGDIRGVDEKEIPKHDLICGGFPCQAFSVAGKRKGFKDTRGTLFFEICRVAAYHRPKLLLLENVKGLLNHDGGRTFSTILYALEDLGYWWEYQVLNSKDYGVPQNRERVFIIGHLREGSTRPIFPITRTGKVPDRAEKQLTARTLSAGAHSGGNHSDMTLILDAYNHRIRQNGLAGTVKTNQGSPTSMGTGIIEPYIKNLPHGYNDGFEKPLPNLKANSGAQYNELVVLPVLTPDRPEKRQNGRRFKHQGEPMFTLTGQDKHGVMEIKRLKYGESQQDRIYYPEGETPSVPASRTDDKMKIFEDARIRRLTPVECERLQGFPDNWTSGVSETQRYKCLGNAVTVNVIEFLGHKLGESINSKSLRIDQNE